MVGLIDRAKVATEETEIAQEKEQIQNVITGFRLDNTQMNAENLQKELNNLSGNTDIKVERVEENDFLVTFPSGRIYEVADGNVEYIGKEGELEDVIISVNKEQDLEEKQIQEVEVTINTYKNRDENQTVKLEYSWSDSKSTRGVYKSATLEGNIISKKAIISSGELDTGNYYLWLKVTVDGKNIEKTYGAYYIKKYPTLVRASNETQTTSGFLGNTDIQRGKIKTITLQNTLDGKKNTDEGKCWDVSTTKNEEILAWYEEENIEGNTYYNVTIGADGKIRANTNSSYLFNYIGNDVIGAEVKIEGLENLDTSNVTNMYRMFCDCYNLTTLNLGNFNTNKVTNMSFMFFCCRSLTSLDVSNFDTGMVTNMYGMFSGCDNLTSLDVSSFNTSNVTNMSDMFRGCDNLMTLNLGDFNTNKVTNMTGMFSGCINLTSLDVSSFNTRNVTNMYDMFRECKNLTSLNVSNFNTNSVTDMSTMFYGCERLTSLDVSNFDTGRVDAMMYTFMNCKSLTTLNLRNWIFNDDVDTKKMFDSINKNVVITVSSQEIKNKLISIYENFTENNFQISE